MNTALKHQILFSATLIALSSTAGCGAEAPPFGDLPLRDALSAAPEALASLPEDDLHDIADRLEEAHAGAGAEADAEVESATPGAPLYTPLVVIQTADARREAEGKDAFVLGVIEAASGGFVLRAIAAGATEPGPFEPPELSGELPLPASAPFEDAALQGRAGRILADLAARADAHEYIRITGSPVGAVAYGGAVYVNASWLVAMSAIEPPSARAVVVGGAPALGNFPKREPKSVRANPYNLPESLAVCASDVEDVCLCAAATSCNHAPTDVTFASGQEECEWVNTSPGNAQALCILALMRIDGVRECVQAGGSLCSMTSVATRDDAIAFLAVPGCLTVLDTCLDRGEPFAPVSSGSGSSGCSGCSGCNGCSGCSRDVDSCNQSCSNCNQNCKDCNQNCEDCNQNCKDCDQNRKDCGKTGAQVSAYAAAPACRLGSRGRSRAPEPPPAPLGAMFWLFIPVGYILRRLRRRP